MKTKLLLSLFFLLPLAGIISSCSEEKEKSPERLANTSWEITNGEEKTTISFENDSIAKIIISIIESGIWADIRVEEHVYVYYAGNGKIFYPDGSDYLNISFDNGQMVITDVNGSTHILVPSTDYYDPTGDIAGDISESIVGTRWAIEGRNEIYYERISLFFSQATVTLIDEGYDDEYYYDVETMDYTYSNYTGKIYSSVYGPNYHIDFTVSNDGKTLTTIDDIRSIIFKRVI